MTVQFFAYYRGTEFAGCKTMVWPEPAGTVYELCHQIADRYGKRFREEILSPDGSAIGERSIVMVNGRRTDFLDGIQTVLKDTDTVQIFPVVAGG